MKMIIIPLVIVSAVLFLGWLGLQIKPAPYPSFAAQNNPGQTIPLPEGLPAPVERYYRAMYGENVPVITSAVISGRGTMAPFGVALPMRFRFTYEIGKDYRALIEATFFGQPVIKGDETYINGHALGKLTTGISEGEWFDDAMNIRVWCEILTWFPAALLSDSRVQWNPIDEDTALLVVPFGEKQQSIIVRFDPESGKAQYVETMKYRSANEKILWINAIWFDQGKPWIHMNIEELVFNVDVQDAIHAAGQ